MKLGYWIGWMGVAIGLCVPIPQIVKILNTGEVSGISIGTYILLISCMTCYLIHAIHIKSKVFIVAQSINIATNSIILGYLIWS